MVIQLGFLGGKMQKPICPKIIIDTREQTPLPLPPERTVRATLRTGDYSIEGYEREFSVERKSLQDLVGTVIHDRERFEYELLRMTHYRFRRVLVEASFDDVALVEHYQFSDTNPKSVIASAWAFEVRYSVPFVFAGSRRNATRLLIGWAEFYAREAANPKGW